MGRPYLWKKCEVCGKMFHGRTGQFYCVKCGIKRVKKVAKQLHKKKGPFFEKWKRGMQRYLDES